jgi:uncharacterized LabA/DUF88 family protein
MFFTRTCWGKEPPDKKRHSFEETATEIQPKAEIGIFWDYENMPVPDWCSAAKASECIRKHVKSRGNIVERKLYFDSSKTSQQPLERSVLDLSGFSLIDCPSRNSKETIDKKAIVDMLCFSYERVLKGSNVHVVLISSDGDYSYALTKLRDIGVSTFVIYSPDRVANILTSIADEAVTWEDDILGGSPASQQSVTREDDILGGSPAVDNTRVAVSAVAEMATSVLLTPALQQSHPTKSHTTDSNKSHANTSITPADGKNTLLFLRSVFAEQEPRHPSWALDSQIAVAFHSRTQAGVTDRAAYRSAKADAVERSYVEIGRQDLTKARTPIVISPKVQAGRSSHIYLRLTALGRLKLQGH